MKAALALALALMVAAPTASLAQVTNASLIGDYVVTGTEVDGSAYDGPGSLAVTMDKSGALELEWDGGKYVGIGQVVGHSVAVASHADGEVVVMVMNVGADGSLEGKWWRRTDAGTKGTGVWKKKLARATPAAVPRTRRSMPQA